MKPRIKLCNRTLPDYTVAEETMNMVTHIAGGALAILITVLCVIRAALTSDWLCITGMSVYGGTMIVLYSMSSIYHGLRTNTSKKVMQVIDHCSIYFLIAGTYTAVMTSAMIPAYPVIGWGMLIFQWSLAILAATLTAIDLEKYNLFSMVCYILMGWGIILFVPQVIDVMGKEGFITLLSGGIAYTIGAVLYGVGKRKKWMHGIFHIFVVLGSVLQFFAVWIYAL